MVRPQIAWSDALRVYIPKCMQIVHTRFMSFLVLSPLKLSQVGMSWGSVCVKDIYDITIPLDHCLLQGHKTHRYAEFHQYEPSICSH